MEIVNAVFFGSFLMTIFFGLLCAIEAFEELGVSFGGLGLVVFILTGFYKLGWFLLHL